MSHYVDGFLIPVPTENLAAYRKIARQAGKIWKDHGALEYRECVQDDLTAQGMTSFVKASRAKADESIIFSYIVFESRAHRDRVNAAVMADPRMEKMCATTPLFDCKRMSYGGFKTIVEA